MASSLIAAWRLHRPQHDTALLIVPEPPMSPTAGIPETHRACVFFVHVASYLLEKASTWFAALRASADAHNNSDALLNGSERERLFYRALLDSRPGGHGVLLVRLPLASADPVLSRGFTEAAVRCFFALIESLYSRIMSDDGATTTPLARQHAEARWTATQAIDAHAREYILEIHALANYFGCRRVMRWVHANLIDSLDDEVANTLLDYATASAADGMEVSVTDSAAEIYALTLMWYHCLRAPSAPCELDARIAFLAQRCARHRDLDAYSVRVHALGEEKRHQQPQLEMRGAIAKCVHCYDHEVTPAPVTWGSTVVQAVVTPTTDSMGYWALHLHEERCASGQRQFTVRHIGADAVQAYLERPTAGPVQNTLGTLARTGLDAEVFAATRMPASSVTSTFECSFALRCIQRDRRLMRAPDTTQSYAQTFTMDATRTGVSKYTVHAPRHWREDDYHTGFCRGCGQIKPVAVLTYALRILQLGNSNTNINVKRVAPPESSSLDAMEIDYSENGPRRSDPVPA